MKKDHNYYRKEMSLKLGEVLLMLEAMSFTGTKFHPVVGTLLNELGDMIDGRFPPRLSKQVVIDQNKSTFRVTRKQENQEDEGRMV